MTKEQLEKRYNLCKVLYNADIMIAGSKESVIASSSDNVAIVINNDTNDEVIYDDCFFDYRKWGKCEVYILYHKFALIVGPDGGEILRLSQGDRCYTTYKINKYRLITIGPNYFGTNMYEIEGTHGILIDEQSGNLVKAYTKNIKVFKKSGLVIKYKDDNNNDASDVFWKYGYISKEDILDMFGITDVNKPLYVEDANKDGFERYKRKILEHKNIPCV